MACLPIEREVVHSHWTEGHQVDRKPVTHVTRGLDLDSFAFAQEVFGYRVRISKPEIDQKLMSSRRVKRGEQVMRRSTRTG